MQVVGLPLGSYRANCYLLHERGKVWIIDPGFDGESIADLIRRHGWKPIAVLLTHSHWDHILGLPGLLASFPSLPVFVHPDDAAFLGPEGSQRLLSLALSLDPSQAAIPQRLWDSIPEPTGTYNDGDVIEQCVLRVIHTPGHSPGSVSLYQSREGLLFSGDTLFQGTIGRTDLPYSDPHAILRSIREKLLTLPPETVVHPGHGPATTIAREMRNPWLSPGESG